MVRTLSGFVAFAFAGVVSLVVAAGIGAQTFARPTITKFEPTRGVVGQKITIYGDNFGGAQEVQFNGVAGTSPITNANGTEITAIVPPEATIGPGLIVVTTPGGTATSRASFTVEANGGKPSRGGAGAGANLRPSIRTVSPMGGKPGVRITILGANLGGALSVKFAGVKATYIVPSATKIIATVPVKARSGLLSVTTKLGTATRHFKVGA